jgi:hypothetical protein
MAAWQVVTANRLEDGIVVYLGDHGTWSERIDEGRLARSGDEAGLLMAGAERSAGEGKVVAPYLIEVSVEGGLIRPVRFREVIRARGPSVRPDHGKQAAGN